MTEELQTQQQPQQTPMQQPQPKTRLGPQDYRNSELVTKFMAANPPYLYSPAVGPHNFFFSEMLRSLVANKRNESLRNATEQLHHHQQQQQQAQAQSQHLQQGHLALQAASTRRPRKRSWSQHRYYPELAAQKEGKDGEDRPTAHPEKPLELTNKLSAFGGRSLLSSGIGSAGSKVYSEEPREGFKTPAYPERKQEHPSSAAASASEKSIINHQSTMLPEPPTGSMPPSDLILPPPPPVWYPPLYPPYGIDPLHFFIDLRVSGHIYDRKKDSNSPGSEGSQLSVKSEHTKLGGDRQGSAFSVPKPRSDAPVAAETSSAINLASAIDEGSSLVDDGAPEPCGGAPLFGDDPKLDAITKNTHYVLQNLPRIYEDLNGNHKMAGDRCLTDDDTNGNMSCDEQDTPEHEQDSKSVGSASEDVAGEENKYKDADLNVISDEESIAVDEN
ncbi:uncharacterized protein LOC131210465 [Anopheles bellator]|uniref:uncharacterized protein LOC131210465 n=1 Tax=Anopheles bellator TaxID=139047 RepID=UPI002648E131|nr:uncharacterized protein LOC131210465 [Anopheles bellator]